MEHCAFKVLSKLFPKALHMICKSFDLSQKRMNTIKNNGFESRRLAELRDTLLPRLMSGELKVNEIENAI